MQGSLILIFHTDPWRTYFIAFHPFSLDSRSLWYFTRCMPPCLTHSWATHKLNLHPWHISPGSRRHATNAAEALTNSQLDGFGVEAWCNSGSVPSAKCYTANIPRMELPENVQRVWSCVVHISLLWLLARAIQKIRLRLSWSCLANTFCLQHFHPCHVKRESSSTSSWLLACIMSAWHIFGAKGPHQFVLVIYMLLVNTRNAKSNVRS